MLGTSAVFAGHFFVAFLARFSPVSFREDVKHRAALQASLLKETAPAEGDLAGALFPEVHAGGGPQGVQARYIHRRDVSSSLTSQFDISSALYSDGLLNEKRPSSQ